MKLIFVPIIFFSFSCQRIEYNEQTKEESFIESMEDIGKDILPLLPILGEVL